jgi:formylglycine-generating enzyme required for sulfatase activity
VVAIAALALAAPAGAAKCPQDSVQVGGLCVDKYEASVWEIPAGSSKLVKKVEKGKIASAAQLGGAIQRGAVADDYGPGCPDDASTACAGFYAVSIPGVIPARYVNWFQAVAVCANAGKRLLTNLEWQVAAFGTPDTGGDDDGLATCNTDNLGPQVLPTGSRSACVSARGAFDMAGNVWEIVGDWLPVATHCPGWGGFSDDYMCFGGASTTASSPGVLIRGADYSWDSEGGSLAVDGSIPATSGGNRIGFRCGREL